jgi:ferric iron reductase protein FhuF
MKPFDVSFGRHAAVFERCLTDGTENPVSDIVRAGLAVERAVVITVQLIGSVGRCHLHHP